MRLCVCFSCCVCVVCVCVCVCVCSQVNVCIAQGWVIRRIHIIRRTVFTRVGQNRTYTPYMTVYLVIFLPKLPYIHHIYGLGQPYI